MASSRVTPLTAPCRLGSFPDASRPLRRARRPKALEANFRRPSIIPYKLTFCITFWCNYKLPDLQHLEDEAARRAPARRDPGVLQEARADFLWVDLTGGEVTLRKDFVEVCARGDRPTARTCCCCTSRPTATSPTRSSRHARDHGGWPREADHHRLDRRRRGHERRDPRDRGRLAAADRDVPAAARDPRRRGRARHDALAEERRPLPGRVRGRQARDPGPRATSDFHVNIVHESPHYLGNTNLGAPEERRRRARCSDAVEAVREAARPAARPGRLSSSART